MGECLLRRVFLGYRLSPKFCACFFLSKDYVLIFAKKMAWATFCAVFFTNSSGHPAWNGKGWYIIL
jgi:hypothetical protein